MDEGRYDWIIHECNIRGVRKRKKREKDGQMGWIKLRELEVVISSMQKICVDDESWRRMYKAKLQPIPQGCWNRLFFLEETSVPWNSMIHVARIESDNSPKSCSEKLFSFRLLGVELAEIWNLWWVLLCFWSFRGYPKITPRNASFTVF